MNIEKDYYQILGVIQTADPAVIRAAYRALAMLYHPDKNIGNEAESNNKMSEINEAFDVLSNELTRAKYNYKRAENDSVFSYKNESNDKNEEPKTDPLHDDWEIAQFHYPDLKIILNHLSTISWKIAYGYKAYLLESKNFSQRLEIANNIEKEYMCKYFGDINIIHEFAKNLIKKIGLKQLDFLIKQ